MKSLKGFLFLLVVVLAAIVAVQSYISLVPFVGEDVVEAAPDKCKAQCIDEHQTLVKICARDLLERSECIKRANVEFQNCMSVCTGPVGP